MNILNFLLPNTQSIILEIIFQFKVINFNDPIRMLS
jgi:hypothetical protein